MTRRAVLYLASPDDARAALRTVAGRPVAFRALLAAVRAGASTVFVPGAFRGGALERAIAGSRSARAATVWLDETGAPPEEPVLLVPAAALVPTPALQPLLRAAATSVLAESRAEAAPIAVAAPCLLRALWPSLARGRPVGPELARALAKDGPATIPGAAWYERMGDPGAVRRVEARLYAGLGSPIDTRLDMALHRRLSRPLSRWAVAQGITPNQLSLAALLVGLAGVWCLWHGSPMTAVLGLLLYAASVVLDHSDGEVARLTLAESRLGEWLDVLADTMIHALLTVAIGATAETAAGGRSAALGWIAALGVVTSAILAKTSPPRTAGNGVGAVLESLGNRDGFYAMLLLFIVTLALRPALLPLLMIVVAAGANAYWLGHLAHRVGQRLRAGAPRP
ncbi:MAG: CDP-alcohol phosphatidyltransferase family protein [Candidatus Rokubacteria bacterium]|nr:CDP-alcohol phosphatidyltransferase family protein [Candidatus Rokubacteria bacterium]